MSEVKAFKCHRCGSEFAVLGKGPQGFTVAAKPKEGLEPCSHMHPWAELEVIYEVDQ